MDDLRVPLVLEKYLNIFTINTLPETNSEFTPENGWLEDDPFLLGFGLFSGANCLFEGGYINW